MSATSDNYNIVSNEINYTIASDYVKVGAGETAHHQIFKLAYGADNTVNYVNSATPLPVGVCGSWETYNHIPLSGFYSLATTIVGFTGNSIEVIGVSGGRAIGITVGSLTVTATNLNIRSMYGGEVGLTSGSTSGIDYISIQGINGAYPVGITTSSSIPVTLSTASNIGVYGVAGATAIGVSFGTVVIRGLTATTDTITVYGGGTASTVSTGLFGFTGTSVESLYSEGHALNVNIKTSTGITVSATDLDIRNLDYTADTVTIVGQGATDNASLATVPTYMNAVVKGGALNQIGGVTGAGWCGAAMNAYLVNSGITFTISASATFSTGIGISQDSFKPIPVHGSTSASYAVWVAGDTANGPILIKGFSGGLLPVELQSNTLLTENGFNTKLAELKLNSDFLIGVKKALFDQSVSVSSGSFPDKSSIYTLVRDGVSSPLQAIENTIVANGQSKTTQDSLCVNIIGVKQQPTFMARTGNASSIAKNLTEFNAASGFTCASGVRIKTSRIATGTNSSQNEIMCVMSVADSALYGATASANAYILYHGDEAFFDVNNIDKINVFYPAYSANNAPHNTGSGITFSFYAS